MVTMIINLMLSLTLTKEVRIEYNTMGECIAASIATAKVLDKLNETETLGYSWKCIPASKK